MDITEFLPIIIIIVIVGGFILMGILFLLPFVGIFGGLGWFISKKNKEARALRQAAQKWQTTTGKIITSRVEVTGGEYTTVSPRIAYAYSIGAKEFQYDQIRIGDKLVTSYSSREAYDLVDKYPVGADVLVYYNPDNPTESTLER